MAKFKINKNKADLPDDLINQHKDFGKLLENHQKFMKYKDGTKPLYKNPGFMSFIIVLTVVLLTFIITEKENESTSKSDSTVKKEVQIISDTKIKSEKPIKENEVVFKKDSMQTNMQSKKKIQ